MGNAVVDDDATLDANRLGLVWLAWNLCGRVQRLNVCNYRVKLHKASHYPILLSCSFMIVRANLSATLDGMTDHIGAVAYSIDDILVQLLARINYYFIPIVAHLSSLLKQFMMPALG